MSVLDNFTDDIDFDYFPRNSDLSKKSLNDYIRLSKESFYYYGNVNTLNFIYHLLRKEIKFGIINNSDISFHEFKKDCSKLYYERTLNQTSLGYVPIFDDANIDYYLAKHLADRTIDGVKTQSIIDFMMNNPALPKPMLILTDDVTFQTYRKKAGECIFILPPLKK